MVKGLGNNTMIYSWMRNRNTLEFLGILEEMNNPDFKVTNSRPLKVKQD
ncbi:hypothetical protein SDC9_142569 [bioreactor metagenome]|uniref:Uncharacterized protein n=1 Tax=bioreactor metagenome TaxID=1076179 RepID=A0A645E1K7_9ZZZZ